MDKPPEQTGFWRARMGSFRYAWRGVMLLFRTQANAKLHLAATLAVLILGFALRISAGEWGILALATGLVLTAEGMNSAVELLGNRITMERDEKVGRAKDLAAGAVLLAAIAAAIAGACIFVPRLLALF